jgi:uncharacterized protein (TIGR03437 family)
VHGRNTAAIFTVLGCGDSESAKHPARTFHVAILCGGDVAATVSYAGLVGAGLYQINVTVPVLPDGDHAVLAQVSGVSTQTGVLLKIKS